MPLERNTLSKVNNLANQLYELFRAGPLKPMTHEESYRRALDSMSQMESTHGTRNTSRQDPDQFDLF